MSHATNIEVIYIMEFQLLLYFLFFLQLFHHWLFHQGLTVEILVKGQPIDEILVEILGLTFDILIGIS